VWEVQYLTRRYYWRILREVVMCFKLQEVEIINFIRPFALMQTDQKIKAARI